MPCYSALQCFSLVCSAVKQCTAPVRSSLLKCCSTAVYSNTVHCSVKGCLSAGLSLVQTAVQPLHNVSTVTHFKVCRCMDGHITSVQCNNVKCSTVQCSAVQNNSVMCSAVLCSAVHCSAVQCSAAQCSVVEVRLAHNGT